MNKENNQPTLDQGSDQTRPSERSVNQPAAKKLFVEPTVSVPADVLETVTFFQTPTIEAATT